ncbi:hypothetical protein [Nostoc sp.]
MNGTNKIPKVCAAFLQERGGGSPPGWVKSLQARKQSGQGLYLNLVPLEHGEFGISHLVQVVWMADYSSLPPEQDMVFGYHVHLQGGKVMKLETPTFNEHWGSQGGLVGFQNRVVKALKLER